MPYKPPISVIIPAYNAASDLGGCLAALVPAMVEGLVREVIVVDCGSTDGTASIAHKMGATLLQSDKGRGLQLHTGAQAASGDWLLFLHADSWLRPDWTGAVGQHLREAPDLAAYFALAYRSNAPQARWLARRANQRANLWGLPYGDQGLLIPAVLYNDVGGFTPIPLMEDVAMVRRLGKRRLAPLNAVIATSAEKYERDGWRKRAYANAFLMLRYLAGANPAKLARTYR